MRQQFVSRLLLLAVLAALTAGCGGGGGSSSKSTPTPTSSDWDTMVWDQDTWS